MKCLYSRLGSPYDQPIEVTLSESIHGFSTKEEVYSRYLWRTYITYNFQIDKKAYPQTLKFLPISPNICMTLIHTKK